MKNSELECSYLLFNAMSCSNGPVFIQKCTATFMQERCCKISTSCTKFYIVVKNPVNAQQQYDDGIIIIVETVSSR